MPKAHYEALKYVDVTTVDDAYFQAIIDDIQQNFPNFFQTAEHCLAALNCAERLHSYNKNSKAALLLLNQVPDKYFDNNDLPNIDSSFLNQYLTPKIEKCFDLKRIKRNDSENAENGLFDFFCQYDDSDLNESIIGLLAGEKAEHYKQVIFKMITENQFSKALHERTAVRYLVNIANKMGWLCHSENNNLFLSSLDYKALILLFNHLKTFQLKMFTCLETLFLNIESQQLSSLIKNDLSRAHLFSDALINAMLIRKNPDILKAFVSKPQDAQEDWFDLPYKFIEKLLVLPLEERKPMLAALFSDNANNANIFLYFIRNYGEDLPKIRESLEEEDLIKLILRTDRHKNGILFYALIFRYEGFHNIHHFMDDLAANLTLAPNSPYYREFIIAVINYVAFYGRTSNFLYFIDAHVNSELLNQIVERIINDNDIHTKRYLNTYIEYVLALCKHFENEENENKLAQFQLLARTATQLKNKYSKVGSIPPLVTKSLCFDTILNYFLEKYKEVKSYEPKPKQKPNDKWSAYEQRLLHFIKVYQLMIEMLSQKNVSSLINERLEKLILEIDTFKKSRFSTDRYKVAIKMLLDIPPQILVFRFKEMTERLQYLSNNKNPQHPVLKIMEVLKKSPEFNNDKKLLGKSTTHLMDPSSPLCNNNNNQPSEKEEENLANLNPNWDDNDDSRENLNL